MKKSVQWLGVIAVSLLIGGCGGQPEKGAGSGGSGKEAASTDNKSEKTAEGGTVKIGILHSLTGTMAISEVSFRDAVLMAVEEINAAGGVLGKKIEPIIVDPASDWPMFAEKAKYLINQEHVAVTFGCWTSVSRKVLSAGLRGIQRLLFYPVQYEGEEQSLNVFYTGAAPNQQLIPAAEYMKKQGFKKFYLLGTDYVFPRTANKVLKALSAGKGTPASDIEEEYTPFHHQDYQTIVGKLKKFSAGGKACVMSTINGDSNVPFYKEFANQGLTSTDCPIMAFSVAEDELRAMDVPPLVGHLACWNYFMSIDTPENKKFVKDFKDYCVAHNLPGGADRVTDDPIEAAYFGVYVWKAAAEKAGSFNVHKVREAVYGPNSTRRAERRRWIPRTSTHGSRCSSAKSSRTGNSKLSTAPMVLWRRTRTASTCTPTASSRRPPAARRNSGFVGKSRGGLLAAS